MGHVKIDVAKDERALTQTYALNTVAGVKALLRDRHTIASRRFRGDTAASDILIDLHSAIESAELSNNQAEVIAWLYGLDFTQGTAAQIMGISQKNVSEYADIALERIAAVFKRWGYSEITTEIREDAVA
ncbi:RNA polymerase subunit sigma [Cohnella silvisoli]|uniref:RNA polymerase subunit sigma n=1 Tax=Cohnella silvisoli TaxID=2873699 RepID=A0ABV1KYV0_9BACL|nr:RNA polymerase subunit sigma [Cohnella silvisoli]MCD9024338.1 RNA polymerase subunit sigma [Cohnella silvisoli]